MMNNKQACIHKSLMLSCKYAFLSVILVFLYGCEGGIVGTGTGPKETTLYQLKKLPDRISPSIPKHLETIPVALEQTQSTAHFDIRSLRENMAQAVRAESWEELNSQLNILAVLRFDSLHGVTLADLAIDEIISRCDQVSECVIPANEIQVLYTQPVINRLIKLYTDTLGASQIDSPNFDDSIESIIDELSQLLGTEAALGETTYTQLNSAPYDHKLSTSFTQFQLDRQFSIEWRDDRSAAAITLGPQDDLADAFNLSYFYQAGEPGEIVIANVESTSEGRTASLNIKVIGSDPDNAGILLESHGVFLGGQSTSSAETVTPDTHTSVDNEDNESEFTQQSAMDSFNSEAGTYTFSTVKTVQGQVDNDGGYATVEEYAIPDESPESVDYVRLFRETFDSQGLLLAGETCLEYSATNQCNSDTAFTEYGPGNAALVDSALYYANGDFSVLESNQDVIRWQVVNLPADIREFAVVKADTALPLTDRAFLCLGYQVVPENIRLFCGAMDDQLAESTEVINVAPDGIFRLIPSARLVQAD